MAVSDWSTTPASNNAAPPNGAPEGMAPSAVNDIIRQMMADIRAFYDSAALLAAATSNFTGTLQYGGVEVGYRGMPQRAFSGASTTAASDAGLMLAYTGTGGHTLTLDSDPAADSVVTIRNVGSGNLTIAGSASLDWYNGSGTISSGSRTLAVGGIVSARHSTGGNWMIWGAGLS